MNKIHEKIKSNIHIYKKDIKTKGIYWSIIHRLYKIPFLKSIFFPIVNFLKPTFITTHGNTLYIDKNDATVSQELIVTKGWEPFETILFTKLIKPRSIVVDIGAHIGWYTLIAAMQVGSDGKVYSFEPNPKNFSLLSKNVKVNNYKNVVLVNKAVSNITGPANLYLNKHNTGDHRLFTTDNTQEHVTVHSVTLDEYFKQQAVTIDLIKMDIQGFEMHALLGTEDILRKNKKMKIITEFQPEYIAKSGSNPADFLKLIRKYGFMIYTIDESKRKLTLVTSDKKLLDSYPQSSILESNFTNLLCTKELLNLNEL